LPISPYMDRTKPQVAKLQENFIKALVGTLFNSYAAAGLLPGIILDNVESNEESDSNYEESSSLEESK
jgi:cGMP-inhibited 3',5'-cyclic phosphodiesterase B